MKTVLGLTPGGPKRSDGSDRDPFTPDESNRLREAARFAAAPLAALTARATLTAALEAYLGRRSASKVLAGPLRRGIGETIEAALLFADLRGFTALSESAPPSEVISALDAWFDRIAGSVHAFGGEVLKFMGDGILAIFPVAGGSPRNACDAALKAVAAARERNGPSRRGAGAGWVPAFAVRRGAPSWRDVVQGNISAADRLDFTAIHGPAVNLVSRLEGLCRPLEQDGAYLGRFRALKPPRRFDPALGTHGLRGIAAPCAVFTMAD